MIQAGQVLNGRYKLLRPLGQGSQAFVWVAEHLALGSQVAVKLIDPELAKQDDARERFAREATAAAKLRSSHVVHILDHGIEGEQPFIVMELLEGEDLFDRLERRKRLTLAETSKIVTQVARALMRAHAEGIIHRDLKPENVFLVRNEDDELAKVLDFGVAKITTPAKAVMVRTGVGTLIGTPHYMSPEQVKGLTEIDHRSDLWSLAVISYQCVTGQLPFDSEGVGDLLIRITMNEPIVPSKLEPDLPPAFDEWFKKACAKEPDDRFETSREMADALARAVGAPHAPVSQPGRVMVNLADSPDLDWGSLAGVRIPIPPRRSAPPPSSGASPGSSPPGSASPGGHRGRPLPAPSGVAASGRARLPTLDAEDVVEVDEGSRPPPPFAHAGAPASTRSPPSSSQRPALVQAGDDNPFLPPTSSRLPQSGRSLQTTVTGLASTSQPAPADLEPEHDVSRRRRATWYVALAVLLAGVGITVGVIRSRGGFAELTGDGQAARPPQASTTAAPPSPAATATTTAQSTQPQASAVASSATSASAAASASGSAATDELMTKKAPKPPASAPPPPYMGPRPRNTHEPGAIIIELPDPDREVPPPRR